MARILCLLMVIALPQVSLGQFCLGDCTGDESVGVNELIIGVNIALDHGDISEYPCFDNGSGIVTVSVLITAVRNALEGCPSQRTPTAVPVPTSTPEQGEIFRGALPRTNGRFTYQATVGIAGADAECNAQFAGSHACTYSELQAAQAAGDLVGAKDVAGNDVTGFWAIDPTRDDVDQCTVTVAWDYATAHTGQFADAVTLDGGSGALGPLTENNICAQQRWVGCCL